MSEKKQEIACPVCGKLQPRDNSDEKTKLCSDCEVKAPQGTIRAHVEGCTKALSVPVDLCKCGGRDFSPQGVGGSMQSQVKQLSDEELVVIARSVRRWKALQPNAMEDAIELAGSLLQHVAWLQQRIDDAAERGFDAVQAIEQSENQYSTLQKAAQVAAAIRANPISQAASGLPSQDVPGDGPASSLDELIKKNEESGHITADDLNIIVGSSSPERQDDAYAPFTIELSKPTEVRVGSAIGLNCPDDQTRLHKVLAMRDKGDYYELDVELLLKPVPSTTPATAKCSTCDQVGKHEDECPEGFGPVAVLPNQSRKYRAELSDGIEDGSDVWVIDTDEGSFCEMTCPKDEQEAGASLIAAQPLSMITPALIEPLYPTYCHRLFGLSNLKMHVPLKVSCHNLKSCNPLYPKAIKSQENV